MYVIISYLAMKLNLSVALLTIYFITDLIVTVYMTNIRILLVTFPFRDPEKQDAKDRAMAV